MPIAIQAPVPALFPVGEKLRFSGVAQAVFPLGPRCGGVLVLQSQEGQVVGRDTSARDGFGEARFGTGFDTQVLQGAPKFSSPIHLGTPQQFVRRGKLFLIGCEP